ncbi:MAG: type II secretion system protein GspE, partial [Lachnospiraceae bacterium]|nr:type II secretion system protein GspE [Lachnospiraceae bacterium]
MEKGVCVMESRKKLRLGDVLINSGVITEEQLEKGLQLQKGSGRKLGETLVDEGIVTEDNILRALSSQLKLGIIDLQNVTIEENVLSLIPVNVLKKHKMIPFEYSPDNMNILRVAMADPMDMAAIDDINIITNLQVEPVVSTTRGIMIALDKYYGNAEVNSALEEYAKEKESQMMEQEDMYSEDVNNSPIVQLVKSMIEQAVRQRSSDIH